MAESGEPSIRNIIETHNQLALSYKQMMMTVIQKQGFLFCFEQQAKTRSCNLSKLRFLKQRLLPVMLTNICI
jgi:hypothetical protein